MAWFRGMGFVLGGMGLALFLTGIGYAFLTPPDPACAQNLICQEASFERMQGRILFILIAASVLLVAGVAMLVLHLRLDGPRAGPPASKGPPQPPAPPVRPRVVARATPPAGDQPAPGPRVSVRRKAP